MNNILLIGKNSFIAKNFINDFKDKLKIFYFNKTFRKNKKFLFEKDLEKIVKKYKIRIILNFAANNDNSFSSNFSKILESNFYLPLSILKISNLMYQTGKRLIKSKILFIRKFIDYSISICNFCFVLNLFEGN